MIEEETDEQSESEELTDREEGGPTSADDSDGEATGGATGTRESEFDSHE